MQVEALTNTGLVREDNQDCYIIDEARGLLVVADGMGGHRAGEVASRLAVTAIKEYLEMADVSQDPAGKLREAVQRANALIYRYAHKSKQHLGMGTTVTAVLVTDNCLTLAHVGDSRAYLVKQDGIELLTQDHSLVGELVRNGSITEEEARCHPHRNILTRALGTEEQVKVDVMKFPLEKGDLILLCTDGLFNLVSEEEMYRLIRKCHNLKSAVQEMINLGLQRGGYDNITVVLARYE
ncbi:Stp1/IreP family PP2C-type Ser/Thr phosphatase [Calderihabitans maritimus]|uniref:protein-serine/threonine phosphatase n=1 Tax=Calderihabitans maritimus TaxID=1246530 RepID=A0A1Z5HQ30_9FIRM|nr:Stp1/IreP family PP2C-type Ser/Thr phosphatase [Calderihabitans maritimus]GAW91421.1 protein serine/threonine phosphatases [Calderihabitans maritimus]